MNNAAAGSASPQPSNKVPFWRGQQGTWLFAAVALGLFLLLAVLVSLYGQPYWHWDLAVSHTVQATFGPGFQVLMRGVSLAGDEALWSGLLVAVACLVLLALRARREMTALLGIVLAAQAVKIAVKLLIGRPRPTPELVE